jgi:uncharacterized membrane protein (DUF485 family)
MTYDFCHLFICTILFFKLYRVMFYLIHVYVNELNHIKITPNKIYFISVFGNKLVDFICKELYIKVENKTDRNTNSSREIFCHEEGKRSSRVIAGKDLKFCSKLFKAHNFKKENKKKSHSYLSFLSFFSVLT